MRFFRSTHLLIFLSLETLTSIIRTGLPILVELINLVNSVVIFLSQMTLPRWLTFLPGFQTVILIGLLSWICFFLLTLVFILKWLSLHWEILIMLLSQFHDHVVNCRFFLNRFPVSFNLCCASFLCNSMPRSGCSALLE